MKLEFFQGVAITIGSSLVLMVNPVLAQITPDATLPNNSQVRLQDNIQFIEGGTQFGGNLFHSLQEFSVPTNSKAYFNNATDIQNILTRVTGGLESKIDGLIRTNGNANLFLINPSGIIFGQNARLDIGGSFLGTTANTLQFGDLGNFSATNPEAPSSLLTINPNALLFNQVVTAPIQNNSIAEAGKKPAGSSAFGLRVPDGKSLLLVGGNITMDGGQLNAYAGRVELGGLATTGKVNLGVDGNNLSLVFPDNVIRSDISLTNRAKVDVEAGGGGSIAVSARNLDILKGSEFSAGIGQGLGTPDSVAGDININATGKVNIVGFANRNTGIFNTVQINTLQRESQGKAGNIIINAGELLIRDGGKVSASTFGAGKAGNLNVNTTQTVKLSGTSLNGRSRSGLLAVAFPSAKGAAGNIEIKTGELLVENGAEVSAKTLSPGNGGNLTVFATDKVELIGHSPQNNKDTSGLFIETGLGPIGSPTASPTGNGGELKIHTPFLRVKNGATISTSTFGQGRAGNLTITTRDLLIENGAEIKTQTLGSGNAGDLSVSADTIKLTGNPDNSQETASKLLATAEQGATGGSGNLNITTRKLLIEDAAQVSNGTWGKRDGGELTVKATERVQVTGSIAGLDSSLNSAAFETATGNGGNVKIDTPKLLVQNGANITVNTVGKQGRAGNLVITTRDLLIENGAFVSAETYGSGKGGNLTINADSIQLIGTSTDGKSRSKLSTNTYSQGDAGDLTINTQQLMIRNGGIVTAVTEDSGKGGNLTVNAKRIELTGNTPDGQIVSQMLATSEKEGDASGQAGQLTIKTHELLVKDGAQVSTGTWGAKNGGELTVNATGSVQVIGRQGIKNGLSSSLNSVAFFRATGNGGELKIYTQKLIVQNGGEVTAETRGRGNAGNLIIDADKLLIENKGQIAVKGPWGNAGNLTINSDSISLNNGIITAETRSPNKDPNKPQASITLNSTDLILRRGSQINTNAIGQNVIGGNININSGVLAVLDNSNISANSTDFRGGRVVIKSEGVFGRQSWYPEILRGKITATGATPDLSGTVEINTPNVDPNRGTTELPGYIINAAALVNQHFCARAYASRFIITGRGGITPSPYDVLESNTSWEDWRLNPIARTDKVGEGQGVSSESEKINTTQKPDELVEAQGWVINKKGQMELVASVPNATPHVLQKIPVECLLNHAN
jgi:filamentous hemagglutinin family protein